MSYPVSITKRQAQKLQSILIQKEQEHVEEFGEDFESDGICDESSLSISEALKVHRIPHKRVEGGSAAHIGWHCWVEVPGIGVIDFCAGQASKPKKSAWRNIVIGNQTGKQIYTSKFADRISVYMPKRYGKKVKKSRTSR